MREKNKAGAFFVQTATPCDLCRPVIGRAQMLDSPPPPGPGAVIFSAFFRAGNGEIVDWATPQRDRRAMQSYVTCGN